MKTKFTFLSICLALMVACKSYEPFSSKKEKNNAIKLVNKKIQLTKEEFNIVKKNDSILYSVSNTIKGNVKSGLIERRLDSFFQKNYNKQELLIILKMDSLFPNEKIPLEIDRRKGVNRLEFEDTKSLKKFLTEGGLEKKLDSVLGMKKKDSTRKKKNNK